MSSNNPVYPDQKCSVGDIVSAPLGVCDAWIDVRVVDIHRTFAGLQYIVESLTEPDANCIGLLGKDVRPTVRRRYTRDLPVCDPIGDCGL